MRWKRNPDGRFSLPAAASVVVIGFFLLLGEAKAQTLYGSMVGRVSDQTGGAIPGADVTVIKEATNLNRQRITDAGFRR